MSTPNKADPAIYPTLRENALRNFRLRGLADEAVHSVLMDWHVGNGTATVLGSADGSASVYFSSGGGYIGGGQGYPAIRAAALQAVFNAKILFSNFKFTETYDLPPFGDVFFYLTTNDGVRFAVAKETDLRAGASPLDPLGAIMQEIITQYRLNFPHPAANRS